MTEKEKHAIRNQRYYERQKKRGFTKINAYIEPETKRQLADLAKEAGSYEAAFQKLLKQAKQNERTQAA